MLKIVPTKQFQKDMVKAHKRGKELAKIEKVIDALAQQRSLPLRYRDHALVGNFSNQGVSYRT